MLWCLLLKGGSHVNLPSLQLFVFKAELGESEEEPKSS